MRLKRVTEKDWVSLISQCQEATPFHTPDWLRILAKTWSNVRVDFFSVEEGSETIGLLPLISKRRFGLRLMGSPLRGTFTPYLGPIAIDRKKLNHSALIGCLVQQYSPDFLEVTLSPGESFDLADVKFTDTVLIDLTKGAEALWRGMKKKTRNQVRKAQKSGVEVYSPEALGNWLSEYYSIVVDTYRRRGLSPPAPLEFYRILWNFLEPKGMLKVLLAQYEGKTVAGGVYLLSEVEVYGVDGALDRRYQEVRPNNLVEWETIAWGASAGFRLYDMLGASIPSIAKFKLGFGGYLASYPGFHTNPTAIGSLSWRFYERFRPQLRRFVRV